VHSIKGLEFGVVFIIDLNDKVLPYPVISSDLLPKRKISDSGELFQDLIDIPIQPT
jgi:superfamily I DNA/RNA helicase